MASSSSSRPPFLPESIPAPSQQRLQALYADFSRQKSINPSSYAANIDWWRRALPEIVAHSQTLPDHLVLDVSEKLVEELRTENGARPAALGTVVLEMLNPPTLYPLAPFLSSASSIYETTSLSWRIATFMIGKPLWWAMSQLRIVGDAVPAEEDAKARWRRAKGKYVVKDNLEKAADNILEIFNSQPHTSLIDRLHNFTSFVHEFRNAALEGVTLSEQDCKVLLKHLERDRGAIIVEKEIIKFVDEDETEETKITEVDRGVLEMKLSIQRLEDQIEEIDRRVTECTEKAKVALGKKQQEMAKSYLRSRKQLEEVLTKRTTSLETIQTILLKIESAAGDIEVMKAYETSTSTLKTLLKDPRLQREYVDATLESMSEALADHAEIEEAVRLGQEGARAAAGMEIDEDEIADELEEMVREEKEARMKKEEAERVAERISPASPGPERPVQQGIGQSASPRLDPEQEPVPAS